MARDEARELTDQIRRVLGIARALVEFAGHSPETAAFKAMQVLGYRKGINIGTDNYRTVCNTVRDSLKD